MSIHVQVYTLCKKRGKIFVFSKVLFSTFHKRKTIFYIENLGSPHVYVKNNVFKLELCKWNSHGDIHAKKY